MRERTEQVTDNAWDELSSWALGRTRSERLAALAIAPDVPLFFGRLDLDPAEELHIGRRHIRDDGGEPVVIDWRAPLAVPFYRAHAEDPMGVARRRRFGFHGGALTSFEDESLAAPTGRTSRIMLAEIERPRVGPMRDIVATIQPDQDVLVRSALEQSLCVQGAPGTGKTAVGLDRAGRPVGPDRGAAPGSGPAVRYGAGTAGRGAGAAGAPAGRERRVEPIGPDHRAAGPVRGGEGVRGRALAGARAGGSAC